MIRSVSARAALRSMNHALGRRRAGLVAEDPVLPERRVQQHALPVPVLGDEADAGLAAGAGAPGGDVRRRPAGRAPAAGGRRPMIASTSSAWPLPSTPAMPTTSPSRTVEVDTSSTSGAAAAARRP